MSVSVDLAAAFFARAGISTHAIGLYAKVPQLMEQLRDCANCLWDRIWWKENHVQRMAREAIGNIRFFHPEAVQAYAGLPFSEEALAGLGSVPFSPERLHVYRNSDCALLADPGLSIAQMRRLLPGEFHFAQHRYEERGFACQIEPPSWLLLSKKALFRGLVFAEQDRQRQEEGGLLLPSARRMVFGALALKLCEGTKYFSNAFVRTDDTIAVWNGRERRRELRRITVGYDVHGPDAGICIDTWADDVGGDRIGMGVEIDPKVAVL